VKNRKFLIVEDDRKNLELMTDLIEAAGGMVIQARSAADGIHLARTGRPDLVLMDVGLPGLDGLTATRVLRNDPATRDIPVVAVTAHVMRGDEEKILASGCQGLIPKPIDTRSFVGLCLKSIESWDGVQNQPPPFDGPGMGGVPR